MTSSGDLPTRYSLESLIITSSHPGPMPISPLSSSISVNSIPPIVDIWEYHPGVQAGSTSPKYSTSLILSVDQSLTSTTCIP